MAIGLDPTQDVDDGRATEEGVRRRQGRALLRELDGYIASGNTDRADQVRAELVRLGFGDLVKESKGSKKARAEAEKPADTEQATA